MDADVVTLYRRYVQERHDRNDPVEPEQFRRFLVDSPVDGVTMRYEVSGRLVGVGWVDVLEDGLSSVYFAFDPDESPRSLGTFSIMEEIRYARTLGKHWLYLGFYVPGSPKMAYKGAFRPREFAVDGAWTEDEPATC
jgi:arginine-tRNA-protein transferase